MKAAILKGIKQIEIVQMPVPEILNDNDILIKVKTIGVCGSDIHYYTTGRIGNQIIDFHFVIRS